MTHLARNFPIKRMFESFKPFKPSEGYEDEEGIHRVFQYGKGLKCSSDLFAHIIYVEYLLRGLMQL